MLKHFQKLRTPLTAIGTLEQMKKRFTEAGWPTEGANIRSLWDLWSDPAFLTPKERTDLDRVEPFDEWEEFALFGSHYFLMVASKGSLMIPVAEGTAISGVPIPESSEEQSHPTVTHEVATITDTAACRRFGACMTVLSADGRSRMVVQHGGLGSRERLKDCDIYTTNSEHQAVATPSLPLALMCHTITPCGPDGVDHLLIGGRSSPDKASASCWLHHDGSWSKVHDLRQGRYRHCAVSLSHSPGHGNPSHTVLVFGGRTGEGNTLNDWVLWNPVLGWQQLDCGPLRPEARFGAAMAVSHGEECKGVLTGGMREDGTVIQDCWDWQVEWHDDRPILKLKERVKESATTSQDYGICFGRFGAALVPTSKGMLTVGGIVGNGMLDRSNEVMNVDRKKAVSVQHGYRPLLVGHAAIGNPQTANEILILGGGATCFSFGTFWNASCVLFEAGDENPTWRLQTTATVTDLITDKHEKRQFTVSSAGRPNVVPNGTALQEVPRMTLASEAEFAMIRRKGQPVILGGLDIGTCTSLWTADYLKSQIGTARKVSVHDSPSPHMNFQTKNFAYATKAFGEFIDAVEGGAHMYLRALSTDKPAERPTSLVEDYPSIAADFDLPPELGYAMTNAHSSPLRISGPVTMWLHYDVMANVLCQVRGTKRLLLYPPSDVVHLCFPPGASSSIMNPFTATASEYPGLGSAHPHEVHLRPGDILYLPPLWLHAAEPTAGLSVAVNVFFRSDDMEAGYAAGKDVYGNRDLAAYERGRRDVQRIEKSFEGLPDQVREFYISRLAEELRGTGR